MKYIINIYVKTFHLYTEQVKAQHMMAAGNTGFIV